jgi:hypothetical protein
MAFILLKKKTIIILISIFRKPVLPLKEERSVMFIFIINFIINLIIVRKALFEVLATWIEGIKNRGLQNPFLLTSTACPDSSGKAGRAAILIDSKTRCIFNPQFQYFFL